MVSFIHVTNYTLKKRKKKIFTKINKSTFCEKRENEQNININPKSCHGERQNNFMFSCFQYQ